jgi:23S rRNA (cytidine1920-2'-O)/16S rRNA (cytidine1409-2'-O)-methyltransferase
VGRQPQQLKDRIRLDTLLVERGLAASRERARALVLAGSVRVNGQPAPKAGVAVARDSEVTVATPDHPYVGRGGLKLAHALDTFGISARDVVALDIGASTGGFTDVLLQRGAAHVVALDVGHGQLDWKLRNDPRVTVMEHVNARYLASNQLPEGTRVFDLITIDVSFISLSLILPSAVPLLQPGGHVVALVKPQFEAGRGEVGKGGIVRDEQVRMRVVNEVVAAADKLGLRRVALVESPVEGMEGNKEFLLHLTRHATRDSPL